MNFLRSQLFAVIAILLLAALSACDASNQTASNAAQSAAPATSTDGETENAPATASALESDKDRFSYALGVLLTQQMNQVLDANADDIDRNITNRAIINVIQGDALEMSDEEVQAAVEKEQQRQIAEAESAAAENLETGTAFLAENKTKEGWQETASGLQYKIVTAGSGASPTPEQTVKVHYAGTLIDGTEFDSSYKRDEPVEFPLNGVIPGWTEGLQLMNAGGKAEFAIPANLAYGPQGRPGIPPNSVLLFTVELLEVL